MLFSPHTSQVTVYTHVCSEYKNWNCDIIKLPWLIGLVGFQAITSLTPHFGAVFICGCKATHPYLNQLLHKVEQQRVDFLQFQHRSWHHQSQVAHWGAANLKNRGWKCYRGHATQSDPFNTNTDMGRMCLARLPECHMLWIHELRPGLCWTLKVGQPLTCFHKQANLSDLERANWWYGRQSNIAPTPITFFFFYWS